MKTTKKAEPKRPGKKDISEAPTQLQERYADLCRKGDPNEALSLATKAGFFPLSGIATPHNDRYAQLRADGRGLDAARYRQDHSAEIASEDRASLRWRSLAASAWLSRTTDEEKAAEHEELLKKQAEREAFIAQRAAGIAQEQQEELRRTAEARAAFEYQRNK